MRKILASTALAAAFAAGPALASDLPSNKAPPAPIFTAAPPVFSWTGVYVGVEGGLDWSRAHGPLNAYGVAGDAPYHVACHNGLLGGMIGYNKQIGSLVLGVEGSGDGLIGGKHSTTSADALGNGYGVTSQSTYDAISAAASASPSTAPCSTPRAASPSAMSTRLFRRRAAGRRLVQFRPRRLDRRRRPRIRLHRPHHRPRRIPVHRSRLGLVQQQRRRPVRQGALRFQPGPDGRELQVRDA